VFAFTYLLDGPIISVDAFPQLGGNVNGPSLIRCPDWVTQPPAKYLLYFAHHEGRSIRLALSDHLRGPWRLHTPAPLDLPNSYFPVEAPLTESLDPTVLKLIEKGEDGNYPHIASPDVWVDHENREIRLYYHGRLDNGLQCSRVALSKDGVNFTAREEILGTSYLRLFKQDNWFYALTMPAQLYRSRDGLGNFETGPCLTNEPIRHHALLHHQGQWLLFWTRVGDQPERILVSTIQTGPDWMNWRLGETSRGLGRCGSTGRGIQVWRHHATRQSTTRSGYFRRRWSNIPTLCDCRGTRHRYRRADQKSACIGTETTPVACD
jgi:hypothetical protein